MPSIEAYLPRFLFNFTSILLQIEPLVLQGQGVIALYQDGAREGGSVRKIARGPIARVLELWIGSEVSDGSLDAPTKPTEFDPDLPRHIAEFLMLIAESRAARNEACCCAASPRCASAKCI